MAANTDTLMAKLFKWTAVVRWNDMNFYLRIVGDATVDDARRIALLESRKLRRSLRDVEGDDFLLYLDPLNDLSDTELKDFITISAMREVMREYINRNPRPSVAELGDYPNQEEQEEHEAAKIDSQETFEENMTAYVDAWRQEFVQTLENQSHEALLNTARKYQTDRVCEDRFSTVFEDIVVSASIYTDDKYKTRMFPSVEAYREIPAELKRLLRDRYDHINIPADELKN